jgi:hypothetical protein
MLSDVIDRVDLAGVGKNARDGVVDERVVFPTIPKPSDDIEILPRPLVAQRRMFGQSKILRRLR